MPAPKSIKLLSKYAGRMGSLKQHFALFALRRARVCEWGGPVDKR
jgi:hypothetical protein